MSSLFLSLALVFTGVVLWAMSEQSLTAGGAILLQEPWGIVTLVDLYLGFFLFAVFIYLTCPQRLARSFWIIALLLLGNVVSCLYLVLLLKTHKSLLLTFKKS